MKGDVNPRGTTAWAVEMCELGTMATVTNLLDSYVHIIITCGTKHEGNLSSMSRPFWLTDY